MWSPSLPGLHCQRLCFCLCACRTTGQQEKNSFHATGSGIKCNVLCTVLFTNDDLLKRESWTSSQTLFMYQLFNYSTTKLRSHSGKMVISFGMRFKPFLHWLTLVFLLLQRCPFDCWQPRMWHKPTQSELYTLNSWFWGSQPLALQVLTSLTATCHRDWLEPKWKMFQNSGKCSLKIDETDRKKVTENKHIIPL